MKKLLVIIAVVMLSGCAKVIKIQESFRSDNYDFSTIQNSRIKFSGTTKIYLKEFKKTFTEEYSDTTKLNNKLYELFVKEFGLQMSQVNIARVENEIPKELLGEQYEF